MERGSVGLFCKRCVSEVFDVIFLRQVNGRELRLSDRVSLGNFEWTPAG